MTSPLPERRSLDHHDFTEEYPNGILFGLVSDTHIPEARFDVFDQAYNAFKEVDFILHAGDMHDIAVLDYFEERCGKPVLGVCGNGDDGSSGREVAPDDPRLPYNQHITVAGKKIGMTHDFPDRPYAHLASIEERMDRHFGGPVDIVIAGDTHVPVVVEWDGVLIINSGSPTFPRNLQTQLGTVAFLDLRDGKLDAWIEQLH